jgi:hypothetical protein
MKLLAQGQRKNDSKKRQRKNEDMLSIFPQERTEKKKSPGTA